MNELETEARKKKLCLDRHKKFSKARNFIARFITNQRKWNSLHIVQFSNFFDQQKSFYSKDYKNDTGHNGLLIQCGS